MDSSKKPDKKNPRDGAFFMSQALFAWIFPLMYKGTRRGLNQDDLTTCLESDQSDVLGTMLERQWDKEIQKASKKNREPKLRNALFRTFWRACVIDGILVFLFVLLKTLQPVVLAQLLVQFQNPNSTFAPVNVSLSEDYVEMGDAAFQDAVSNSGWADFTDFIVYAWNDIYWLSGLLVVMILLACFAMNHSDLRQRLVGARMRIACCSAIYRKTLRMSKKAAGRTPAGYLVNLLSNDVGRLDYGFIYVHYIWILPIQSVLICYLIWREVGVAAFVGVIGLLLKTIPVQTGLSRLSALLRMKVAKCTDERVGIMNELIQGIQVIKMYAWEIPFQKVVATARKKEVNEIKWASYIRGIYLSTMVFTERSTLLLAVITCVFTNVMITADVVFSMAQFFNILQLVAAIFYPLAVSFGAEALVSVTRIQEYLLIEEQDDSNVGLHRTPEHDHAPGVPDILVQDVTAKWELSAKLPTLANVSVKVPRGSLCAFVGPVGSGKSSLLHLLLGELPIFSGNVTISESISYASQEPWLFTGTVRNNILFGLPYNRKRYRDVVKYCALMTDFEQLPRGDQTIVGERGAALSGGQKARVSLARAVYKEAQVYLLDDPLSAVDAHVGKFLFEECCGPNGYLASQKATRVLVTHQVHFLTEADWIVVLDEGRILMQGTYNDLANSNLDFGRLLQPQEPKEDVIEPPAPAYDEDDDEIPYIDGAPSKKGYRPIGSTTSLAKSLQSLGLSVASNLGGRIEAEEQAVGMVPFRVWKKYFLAGANVLVLFLMVIILLSSQVVTSGSDYFMNFWTNQEYLRFNNETTMLTTYECLYCYTGLIVAVILMTIMRGWLYFNICMRASKKLHNSMFACMLRAPMSFFDANPSGRILNRFSKDMGAIDELLPKAMMESIQNMLVMVGILVVIMIVNPMLLIPLAVAIFLFTVVLNLYLRPAQDWKRRSPVFSHLSATLNGLSTIRANNAQEKLSVEFDELQDVHSGVWHLTMSSNTALGLWLDCISAAFIACVTFSFIVLNQRTFSGNVGLAISQSLILTGMVQYGIRQTTESLQQMTCVERVIEYSSILAEPNPERRAPTDWPWKAQIQFKHMSLSYGKGEPVLKDLNFDIEPTWKVGIVGRTGAGKSSLISALFRLADIEGKILIDGIDTGVISLDTLRSKISIIPQDPVLFSATIRYNLDPFNLYEDAELWAALEDVELKSSIQGLHFMVTEGGSNFSVGQRQLICLARAILRNNRILVLDEATANVDPQTDALIQTTIRDKFRQCTVLTVAHRLHTVMDSDRILVMEAGYAKEFDIPHVLLQQEDSILSGMVNATGQQESESLKRIAADTYSQNVLMNKGKTVFTKSN